MSANILTSRNRPAKGFRDCLDVMVCAGCFKRTTKARQTDRPSGALARPVFSPRMKQKRVALKTQIRSASRQVPAKSRSSRKVLICLRIDRDVLEWFKSRGPGYQTRINTVLRAFRDASL